MPLSPRFDLHRRGRAFRIRRRDVRSGRRAPWQPHRPSKLIPIGTLPLTVGVVVSYSYPGSDKRKCKRKVPASGQGRCITYIAVGDFVRGNFCEIYLLAVDRKVLAEQQIKRESGTRNRAVGDGHVGAPVETRNFSAA